MYGVPTAFPDLPDRNNSPPPHWFSPRTSNLAVETAETSNMLHDSMIGKENPALSPSASQLNRRDAERHAVDTEVVVNWHFQPDVSVRYRSLDFSETGMRIVSSTPLLEGMTGVLVSTLPEGRPIDRAVMIVWTRKAETPGVSGFEAGLRFF